MQDATNHNDDSAKNPLEKGETNQWAELVREQQIAAQDHLRAPTLSTNDERNHNEQKDNTTREELSKFISARNQIESGLSSNQKLDLENLRLAMSSPFVTAEQKQEMKRLVSEISPELEKINDKLDKALVKDDPELSAIRSANQNWYRPYEKIAAAAESFGALIYFVTPNNNSDSIELAAVKIYGDTLTDIELNRNIPLETQFAEIKAKDAEIEETIARAKTLGCSVSSISVGESGPSIQIYTPSTETKNAIFSLPLDDKTETRLTEKAQEQMQKLASSIPDAESKTTTELAQALFQQLLNKRDEQEHKLDVESKNRLRDLRTEMAKEGNKGYKDFRTSMITSISPEIAETSQQLTLVKALRIEALENTGLLEKSQQWLNPYEGLFSSEKPQIVVTRSLHTNEQQKQNSTYASLLVKVGATKEVIDFKLEQRQEKDSQLNELESSSQEFSKAASILKQNGLEIGEIEREGDSYQAKVSYSADNSQSNEIKIEFGKNTLSALESLALKRESEISDKYNVKFAQPGELFHNVFGPSLHSRIPTPAELFGLERALEKSVTALPSEPENKLKFFFSVEQSYIGTANAEFWSRAQYRTQPTIVAYPHNFPLNKIAPTQTFIHELSHLSQYRAWGDTSEIPDKLLDAMGWQTSKQLSLSLSPWELKGRDGINYCFQPNKRDWKDCAILRIPPNPNEIPAARAAMEAAPTFETQAVRTKALITPPTYYFDNPIEMDAELLTQYRHNERTRATLIAAKNGLYEAAKEQDQEEIDRKYPRTGNEPTMLRLPNGFLAKNTAETRASVADFEKRSLEKQADH